MADSRTVLDVVGNMLVCNLLGIDPAMPFDQFARCLRYGKNADELLELRRDWQHNRIPDGSTDTWNDCLDAIKGDR